MFAVPFCENMDWQRTCPDCCAFYQQSAHVVIYYGNCQFYDYEYFAAGQHNRLYAAVPYLLVATSFCYADCKQNRVSSLCANNFCGEHCLIYYWRRKSMVLS